MRTRLIILAVIAGIWWMSQQPATPTPSPEPAPGEIDLHGAFVGETAADDAAIVAALCGELADTIEWDAMQSEPVLTTGVALDQLRTRARELRCRGRCLGESHPEVARRVGDYLERKLGTAGGPVSPEQLAKWSSAYREIERAAEHVLR